MRRYSLLTLAGDEMVLVHRLVQGITRALLPAQAADQWKAAASALVEAAVPAEPDLPDAWPACAVLLPHARAVLDPTSSMQVRRIARYLGHSGSPSAVRDMSRLITGVLTATGSYGPDHPVTLASCYQVARWTGVAGVAVSTRFGPTFYFDLAPGGWSSAAGVLL